MRRRRNRAYLLPLLGVLIAAAAGHPVHAAAQEVTVEAGDVVRLYSWADSTVRGDYRVDERGIAILPYLGEVNVAGASISRLRESLRTAYGSQVRDPSAIEITPLRRIVILGDVFRPGVQLIEPTTTLVEAIALVGGVTPDAEWRKVRVVRDGVSTEFDLTSFDADAGLEAVDQIFVPRRSWASRNMFALVSTGISTSFSLAFLLISIL